MLETLSPAHWYRELARFPQAGFCHTPNWARLVREVWGGEAMAVLHPAPDGQDALLPLMRRKLARQLLPWSVSGETGVYGGPLLAEPLSAAGWRRFWADLYATFGSMTLFMPPGSPWQAPERGEVVSHGTHRLDLVDGPPSARYNRGLKAKLNRARRNGVTIREGLDAAAVEGYYRLYQDTLARWGSRTSWVRPKGFYTALFTHGQPEVRLYLAYRGEAPVAGVWVAHFGGEAHYLAGSTAAEGLALGGSHLLLDHAVTQAAAAGHRWFDFGASGGREGLIHFKESFGATAVPYPEIRLWAPPVRLYWWWKSRRGSQLAAEEVTC